MCSHFTDNVSNPTTSSVSDLARSFMTYAAVNAGLLLIDVATGPGWWFFWPVVGWGAGLTWHALRNSPELRASRGAHRPRHHSFLPAADVRSERRQLVHPSVHGYIVAERIDQLREVAARDRLAAEVTSSPSRHDGSGRGT